MRIKPVRVSGRLVKLVAFVFLLSLLSGLRQSAQSADGITYVYDELGRLVAVVDANGESARYTYDAVGNLLSISRYDSSHPAIHDFAPKAGPFGTVVTLHGVGFATAAVSNTVTFNGTQAAVMSAETRRLVVQVPTGATTGLIRIVVASGSATSALPFNVTSASAAPQITSFAPGIGSPSTPVALQGTGFASLPNNNLVAFNRTRTVVTAAAPTALTTIVPPGGTSGRISLATPLGRTESVADFYVPPPPWSAQNVAATGRITIGGPALTVTIGAANRVALVLFDGTAGSSAVLTAAGVTIPQSELSVRRPDGGILLSSARIGLVGVSGRSLSLPFLPATGTYTILVHPANGGAGSMTLALGSVDLSPLNLAPAGPIGPNPNGTYTFTPTLTIKNSGSVAPPQLLWNDNLYLSADATVDASDRQLVSVFHSATVGPGATYAVRPLIFRLAAPPGAYHLVAVVDQGRNVPETSETNNTLAAPLVLGGLADLEPKTLTAPPAVEPNGDGTYTLTPQWSIGNAGASAAQPAWQDALYLSADSAWDPSDRELGAVFHTAALNPSASYSAQQQIWRAAAAPGTYYLIVVADKSKNLAETNETNNALAVPLLLKNRPDLVPKALSAGGPIAPNADGTYTFTPSWSVRNAGSSAAQPWWYDGIFLSTDAARDAADRELVNSYRGVALAPAAEYSTQAQVWRAAATPGSYYLLLVADKSKTLAEADEGNNVLAVPLVLGPRPDLLPTGLTAPSTIAHNIDGTYTFTPSWSAKNGGASPAQPWWYDGLYLSTNPAWDPSDVALGSVYHGTTLSAGAAYTAKRQVWRAVAAPGNYYLLLVVDKALNLAESNESNNTFAIPIALR